MIYKLALLHIFGRGSWWKLTSLYLAAGVLSLFLASGLGQFEASLAIPEWRMATTVFVTSQAAAMLVLFVASGTLRAYGIFEQILVHWPIRSSVRWLALMLPAAILASLTTILICLPLGVIASRMGLSIGLYIFALALGATVSFCGYWALKGRRFLVGHAIALAILALEYKSISFIANGGPLVKALVVTMWVLGLAVIIGLFMTSRHALVQDVIRKKQNRVVRTTGFTVVWFGKKVWRRQSLLINFATTMALSLCTALLCLRHPEYTVFAGLTSGLLGATMAADIRSVARKDSPTEIAGVRGTAYFLRNHLCVACVAAILATLPLTLLNPTVISTYTQLYVGISAGFFAGTLLVPASRDIAAQCTATLVCICLLLVPDHLTVWGQSSPLVHSVGQIVTALLLLLASAGIEYKRNNYRWRYHAA